MKAKELKRIISEDLANDHSYNNVLNALARMDCDRLQRVIDGVTYFDDVVDADEVMELLQSVVDNDECVESIAAAAGYYNAACMYAATGVEGETVKGLINRLRGDYSGWEIYAEGDYRHDEILDSSSFVCFQDLQDHEDIAVDDYRVMDWDEYVAECLDQDGEPPFSEYLDGEDPKMLFIYIKNGKMW